MTQYSKTLSVLLLGGAKRVSMCRMIVKAAAVRGVRLNLYSYELHHDVPIVELATVIIGRHFDEPDILEHLHEVVCANNIQLMIPFVDAAVPVAARYVDRYQDVSAPVVNAGMADALFDKIESARLFESAGLPIPATYKSGRPHFPLIAKPRYGSASKGIEIIETIADFRRIVAHRDKFLLQQYVEECDEYTVDCYVASDGRILCISPRRRLEVVGGEVARTITVDNAEIVAITRRIIESLHLTGALTVQFLSRRADGLLLLMEINPRLGGGAVCTVHAGGDLPGFIIDEAVGNPLTPASSLRHNTLICRYFQEVAFFLD